VELQAPALAALLGRREGEAGDRDGDPAHGGASDVPGVLELVLADGPQLLDDGALALGPAPVRRLAVAAAEGRVLLTCQQPQRLVLVRRLAQPLEEGRDLVLQVAEQPVVRIAAVVPALEQCLDAPLEPLPVDLRRLDARPGQAAVLCGQVPVGLEDDGQVAQVVHADVAGERQQQAPLQRAVVEELLPEARPAVLELDLGGDLVEDLDVRRQPGLQGMLGEDALGEGVQGRDGCRVDLLERRGVAGGVGGRAGGAPALLERPTDPVAKLAGRLLGEGDGRDGAHRHALVHQGDDPVDQGLGLAGARARLDEQGLVERVDDALPCVLVGQHHDASSAIASGSMNAT
jgi:hypothetical protein